MITNPALVGMNEVPCFGFIWWNGRLRLRMPFFWCAFGHDRENGCAQNTRRYERVICAYYLHNYPVSILGDSPGSNNCMVPRKILAMSIQQNSWRPSAWSTGQLLYKQTIFGKILCHHCLFRQRALCGALSPHPIYYPQHTSCSTSYSPPNNVKLPFCVERTEIHQENNMLLGPLEVLESAGLTGVARSSFKIL